MIFKPTRTRRIALRLTELTLGQAIDLCKLPGERNELTTTELLRGVAAGADQPLPRYVTDPLLWTVQERTLLVCEYMAHVTSDGPDFAVGDVGHLSDYVMFDRDLDADQIDLGTVAEKACTLRPLLGVHAQALEVLCKTRGDWIIGAIACQIFVASEAVPDWSSMSDIAMMDWVRGRMDRLKLLPESLFEELFAAYWGGTDKLAHFFSVDFDDDGLVYLPIEKEGAGPLSPARFLADSCISSVAQSLSGRAGQPGR